MNVISFIMRSTVCTRWVNNTMFLCLLPHLEALSVMVRSGQVGLEVFTVEESLSDMLSTTDSLIRHFLQVSSNFSSFKLRPKSNDSPLRYCTLTCIILIFIKRKNITNNETIGQFI